MDEENVSNGISNSSLANYLAAAISNLPKRKLDMTGIYELFDQEEYENDNTNLEVLLCRVNEKTHYSMSRRFS